MKEVNAMNFELIKKEILSNLPSEEITCGENIFNNCDCQILSQSAAAIDFLINTDNGASEYSLLISENKADELPGFTPILNKKPIEWNRYSYACLLQYEEELHILDHKERVEHKKYTRQGMIRRVLDERRAKADKAMYHIQWADNIYGNHILTNEYGDCYKVLLRDFKTETGYSDSWDAKLNKLGTTKHIMYAFSELKKNKKLYNKLSKTYPFIEVYCNPLNEYKITWYYPHQLPKETGNLINQYFKDKNFLENDEEIIKSFLGFIEKAEEFGNICLRSEVKEKVERVFEKSMLKELEQTFKPDYSIINAELFAYQKAGIEFVLFKKVAIIADEMGLGKTLQAIATAILKKEIFGFNKTLIVCPATLKSQWKNEIEKFTNEEALIVNGTPKEREKQYLDSQQYFLIVNYETILRDSQAINKAGIDFLILDEAQRIKNYETKTNSSIKRLQPKHTLIITGTPIENKLIDIFSVVSVLDPYFFGPLWEFSYQHCLFDPEKVNKINGYYNLQTLNEQLSEILLRREKRNVLEQLPNVQQIDVPVKLSREQAEYHASYASGIAKIISKKFLTAYDMQRLQLLLCNMRMVCDSTYLIDEETNVSPKMDELKNILFDQFDLRNTDRKIIIFSEWVKVHKLIGQMLRENKIGFVELNGKIPVKSRGELIKKFESSSECKVFLSTEAGGAGLNLQIADTLVNFELPWNPAKKNQRIGRINRLGQKSSKLTIYNLITQNSIEMQIAAGLLVKQNLFEGVLDSSSKTDYVDFSSNGRSQFIDQLEKFLDQTNNIEDETDVSIEPREEFILPAENTEDFELTNLIEEESTNIDEPSKKEIKEKTLDSESESKTADFEQIMTSGMQFLAGLYKMSTGKEMGMENQQIKINKETGEVTMTFKLPINDENNYKNY